MNFGAKIQIFLVIMLILSNLFVILRAKHHNYGFRKTSQESRQAGK